MSVDFRDGTAAAIAISEQMAYSRHDTSRTDQIQRSFEDTALKQRAQDLVLAA